MIGLFLKTMRKSKNITQKELSELTKIPQNTISQYETGTIQPIFETINKIAVACGYKIVFENNNTKLTTDNIERKAL